MKSITNLILCFLSLLAVPVSATEAPYVVVQASTPKLSPGFGLQVQFPGTDMQSLPQPIAQGLFDRTKASGYTFNTRFHRLRQSQSGKVGTLVLNAYSREAATYADGSFALHQNHELSVIVLCDLRKKVEIEGKTYIAATFQKIVHMRDNPWGISKNEEEREIFEKDANAIVKAEIEKILQK